MAKSKSYFPGIGSIPYLGPDTSNPLAFRYYDPKEVIDGRPLKDHLRFSVAYWHSFRGSGSDPFGVGTIRRDWERGSDPVAIAKRRMEAAFEFFTKIQAPFWCFHDRDIAPEGRSLAETNRHLDVLVTHAKALQKSSGIRNCSGEPPISSPIHATCAAPRQTRTRISSLTPPPR